MDEITGQIDLLNATLIDDLSSEANSVVPPSSGEPTATTEAAVTTFDDDADTETTSSDDIDINDVLQAYLDSLPATDQVVFQVFLEQYPDTGWEAMAKLFQDMIAEHGIDDFSYLLDPDEDTTVGIYGTFGFQYMSAVQTAAFLKSTAGFLSEMGAGSSGDWSGAAALKLAGANATTMSYSNWAADTIQNTARKVNGLWNETDDIGQALLAFESVLSGTQVATNVMFLLAVEAKRQQAELALEIQNFHKNIDTQAASLSYQPGDSKDTFLAISDLKTLLAKHEEFLKYNADLVKGEVETLTVEKDALQTALDTARQTETNAQAALTAALASLTDAQTNLAQVEQDIALEKAKDPREVSDAELEALRTAAIEAEALAQTQADAAQTALTEAQTATTTAEAESNQRNAELTVAQNQKASVDTVVGDQLNWVSNIDPTLTNDIDLAARSAAKWGIADNGISLLRSATSLGFWSHEKSGMGASDELIASLGLGVFADVFYTGQSASDFLGSDAKKGAALGLLGSALGLASAATGLADITRQLDNPDLTVDQRAALTASAALQGSMMAAMAAEGAASATALLSHSATALKYATKAVPIAGAVTTVLSVLDPVTWQKFEATLNYIDDLREHDDGTETNGLLADRLEETYNTEVAHYASAVAVDAVFGVASIALAATGVGAPVAVAVAIVGAAISTIIRLTDGNSWQHEADKLAEDMRTLDDGTRQTIEEFFEKQMDTRWDAIAAEQEERFDKILQNNFDSIIALGSLSFTAEDASLAIQSDTISEMGSTAKHYGSEYFGQGNWDSQTVSLDESSAQIDLPDGDADKDVYVTFMTPLMPAVNETYTPPMLNLGKGGGTTTTEVSGWTINDGSAPEVVPGTGGKFSFVPTQWTEVSETSTTFNVANVITDYVPLAGHNVMVNDLALTINAYGGDDTYLADQAKVVFNGGAGEDTASYMNIDSDRFARGINVTAASATALNVTKTLSEGSEYLREVTKTKEEKAGTDEWGKDIYKTVEYRGIELATRDSETEIVDRLTNIEVFQASDLNDILDLRGNATVERIFGFGGNDEIYAGDQTKVVLAGDGDDYIVTGELTEYVDGGAGRDLIDAGETLAKLLAQVAAGTADQDDAVFLFGGDDIDAVVFDADTMRALREQYAEQQVAATVVEYFVAQWAAQGVDVDLARGIFEQQLLATSGDDFNLALFKDIEHLVFDLADIEMPVDEGMNGAAFTHYIYDLTTVREAEGDDAGAPLTLTEFLSDPNNTIEDWVAPLDGYALPVAKATETRTDTVSASLSANQIHHFVGRVYLEAGVAYAFQEAGDAWGAFHLRHSAAADDVERAEVLREATTGTTAGTFTATEEGWYDYDYYARTTNAAGTTSLEIRDVDADTAFEVLNGQDDPSLRLGFTSPMLAGSDDDTVPLENHWHAQDFNTMIASVLQAAHGLPYLTRNTSKEIYEDAGDVSTTSHTYTPIFGNLGKGSSTTTVVTENFSIDLQDWTESNQADYVEANPGRILDEELEERTLVRYQGEIWLEQDEVYTFRESADAMILFTLSEGGAADAVTLLEDARANVDTEVTYTSSISGWHDFEFYAVKHGGSGSAELEIGVVSEYDDLGNPTNWQFQTLVGNMAMSALLDASDLTSGTVLQGADLSESFIGSDYDDFIFGMNGHDQIDGGAGSDAMSGGAGVDTFVFGNGSGHDLIMELYASDWENNRIEILDDGLRMDRVGDDLLFWFQGRTRDSLTLLNFYEDGDRDGAGPLRQELVFVDGDILVIDTQTDLGSPAYLSTQLGNTTYARNTAFAQSDVIESAYETEAKKEQFLNGTYQQDLLSDLEDWLGL